MIPNWWLSALVFRNLFWELWEIFFSLSQINGSSCFDTFFHASFFSVFILMLFIVVCVFLTIILFWYLLENTNIFFIIIQIQFFVENAINYTSSIEEAQTSWNPGEKTQQLKELAAFLEYLSRGTRNYTRAHKCTKPEVIIYTQWIVK